MQQSLRPHSHPDGFNPCRSCRRFDLSITDVNKFYSPSKDTYVPGGWMLAHWHGSDRLLQDDGLGELSRYCHGHSALSGDVNLKAATREALRSAWNARNPLPRDPSIVILLKWIRSFWPF